MSLFSNNTPHGSNPKKPTSHKIKKANLTKPQKIDTPIKPSSKIENHIKSQSRNILSNKKQNRPFPFIKNNKEPFIRKKSTPSLPISQANTKENSKNLDILTLKYYKSDLKKTILIDNMGNNNLNISPSRLKSKKELMNAIKNVEIEEKSSHLFEDISSVILQKEGNLEEGNSKIQSMIIFDQKQREEIDNISILGFLEEEDENNKTIEENGFIDFPLFSPRDLLSKKKKNGFF